MIRRRCAFLFVLLTGFLDASLPVSAQILNQDQEIQVHDLPMLMAHSHDPGDVLLTSLDTIFHDKEICCGRDSALVDSVQTADPTSLKSIAAKLDGRHLLSDGRPIKVTAEYLTPDAVNAGLVLGRIMKQHAALMMWKDHLYVVYGAVFVWNEDSQGTKTLYLHKLLLWDTRYFDSRRAVIFDREKEDPGSVQGLLFAQVEPND